MDKDKYLEWKLREKLLAMIDASNLIKSVDDLQLIPALEDYVRTGNREMFDEYCKFHSCMEEKEKIIKAEAEKDETVKRQQSVKDFLEKEKEAFKVYIDDYEKWWNSTMKQLEVFEASISSNCASLKTIKKVLELDIAQKAMEGKKCCYLYVNDGEKLRGVNRIEIKEIDGKYRAVLDLIPSAFAFHTDKPLKVLHAENNGSVCFDIHGF